MKKLAILSELFTLLLHLERQKKKTKMLDPIKKIFPSFSTELVNEIETNATIHSFETDTIIIRTGQYIKNTVLVTKGKIKIYREDENGGEFFMYHLQPGQACAISMICATKNEKAR